MDYNKWVIIKFWSNPRKPREENARSAKELLKRIIWKSKWLTIESLMTTLKEMEEDLSFMDRACLEEATLKLLKELFPSKGTLSILTVINLSILIPGPSSGSRWKGFSPDIRLKWKTGFNRRWEEILPPQECQLSPKHQRQRKSQ